MRAARAMVRPGVRVADARSAEVSPIDIEGSSLRNRLVNTLLLRSYPDTAKKRRVAHLVARRIAIPYLNMVETGESDHLLCSPWCCLSFWANRGESCLCGSPPDGARFAR